MKNQELKKAFLAGFSDAHTFISEEGRAAIIDLASKGALINDNWDEVLINSGSGWEDILGVDENGNPLYGDEYNKGANCAVKLFLRFEDIFS